MDAAIHCRAYAKLTLSLRIGAVGESGLHTVSGRFQSIDWYDSLSIATADEDTIGGDGGGEVIDGTRNLAWRAAAAVRDMAIARPPLAVTLRKRLPVAAGLGGGSADAAAALAGAGKLLGVDRAELIELAPQLGSDVPFCFVGGSAWVGGYGESVDTRPKLAGFAVAIVVPPIEVATASVYRAWDRLGGPHEAGIEDSHVPPQLRSESLANDLLPAAVDVAPEIAEWRDELAHRWGRPVALAGSGPSLYAFFVDSDEAASALDAAPVGVRAAAAAAPVDWGWMLRAESSEQVTDSRGRVVSAEQW